MNAKSRKPSRFLTCGTVGAILFVAGPRELAAQCEVQKLTASDTPGDAFGWAVSVGNDVLRVTAVLRLCRNSMIHRSLFATSRIRDDVSG